MASTTITFPAYCLTNRMLLALETNFTVLLAKTRTETTAQFQREIQSALLDVQAEIGRRQIKELMAQQEEGIS